MSAILNFLLQPYLTARPDDRSDGEAFIKEDEYKHIIIYSLWFLKKEGSIAVNAFVIMPNHLHRIIKTFK